MLLTTHLLGGLLVSWVFGFDAEHPEAARQSPPESKVSAFLGIHQKNRPEKHQSPKRQKRPMVVLLKKQSAASKKATVSFFFPHHHAKGTIRRHPMEGVLVFLAVCRIQSAGLFITREVWVLNRGCTGTLSKTGFAFSSKAMLYYFRVYMRQN